MNRVKGIKESLAPPHCSIKPRVIIYNIAVVYDLMYDEDDRAADVLVLLLFCVNSTWMVSEGRVKRKLC